MSQESQRFPVTIKQCRVIEEIANKRSESLASESLNLTQSNVSRTLTMAEKALGCKVFNRGWGGSNPTTEGECVISHCNTVMREIRATERHLKEISGIETLLTAYVEWRQLVTVDVLVELGSASAAAQKLRQSQPAVSRGRLLIKHSFLGISVLTSSYFHPQKCFPQFLLFPLKICPFWEILGVPIVPKYQPTTLGR